MRHISLRQLRVFESIARHMSFTRAAEELFLTQPTVSLQIKKLADDVGLPLFEQVGKKIFLTAAGQELYAACRDILERIERLDMSLAEMKGLKRGIRARAFHTHPRFPAMPRRASSQSSLDASKDARQHALPGARRIVF